MLTRDGERMMNKLKEMRTPERSQLHSPYRLHSFTCTASSECWYTNPRRITFHSVTHTASSNDTFFFFHSTFCRFTSTSSLQATTTGRINGEWLALRQSLVSDGTARVWHFPTQLFCSFLPLPLQSHSPNFASRNDFSVRILRGKS